MIQPIETRYNGYRFRSRTEARWAIFFEVLNIRYEYEPDGFLLSNGEKYLPDFYLPEFSCYAEIKPDFNGDVPNELVEKLWCLANETEKAALLLDGQPDADRLYRIFCNDTTDSGGGSYDFGEESVVCFRTENGTRRPILIAMNEHRKDRTFCTTLWEPIPVYPNTGEIAFNSIAVHLAVEHARSARFEYGECGPR